MNQKIVVTLLAVLLMPGASAFAQFKTKAQAVKNLANLDRVIERATKSVVIGRPVVTNLPPGLVRGNAIGLLRVKMPKTITPVNKSYVTFLNNKFNELSTFPTPESLAGITANEWANNPKRTFYQDQTQLARDLNEWYQGKADVLIGPEGRKVKLYALPVDGILYKPANYKDPVVLNSNEYFVIYDVAADTGKIAENKPEVYNLFKPRLEDEIWQAMGADKIFDDLNNLCDAVLLAHLHKARLAKLRTEGNTQETAALVKEGKAEVYKQLGTQEELLGYLKQLPQVRQVINGNPAYLIYLVELPVDGLVWVDRDGVKHAYNPKDHVMVFFEMGAVGVFPRTDVENPKFFQPVKPVTPHANNNSAWLFYKAEKFAWITDRKGAWFETLWNFGYPRHFASQKALGEALDSFHRQKAPSVYDKLSHQISYVYEIPVIKLSYDLNGKTVEVNPDEYVFLYNAQTGGKLVKRADLENANLYKFLDK